MLQLGRRRSGGVIVGMLGLVALVLIAGRPPIVRAAEPAHAAGVITWAETYAEESDSNHCGMNRFFFGDEGTLNLRMTKVGGSWVDAGSTYTVAGGGAAAPCTDAIDGQGCWKIGDYGRSGGHGRVVDPGDPQSWIILNVNPQTKVAMLTLGPHGTKAVESWTLAGKCEKSELGKVFTFEGGSFITGGVVPACPHEAGAEGVVDGAGLTINFECLFADTGTVPVSKHAYLRQTRVDGVVRLTP